MNRSKFARACFARADFTEMVEAVDAGGMAVGEFDLDRIGSYGRGGTGSYFRLEHGEDGDAAGGLRVDVGRLFMRFFACSTGTMFAEIGKVVMTGVRV